MSLRVCLACTGLRRPPPPAQLPWASLWAPRALLSDVTVLLHSYHSLKGKFPPPPFKQTLAF